MKLIKDEEFSSESKHSGFCDKKGDNDLYFDNGVLNATAYSYEIGTSGTVSLNEEQTKQVYEFMKKYYEGEK